MKKSAKKDYNLSGNSACRKKGAPIMASEYTVSASLQVDRGTYVVRGRIVNNETGDTIQRSKSTGLKVKDATKRAAEKAMRDIIAQWENEAGPRRAAPNPMYEEYVIGWINKKRLSLKENSIKSYLDYANVHIIPKLGHIKIRSLRLEHLQKFYAEYLKDHSVSSARKVHVVVSGAILDAVRDGIINVNFAEYVEFPKEDHFVGKAYEPSQVRALLDAAKEIGEPVQAGVILSVCYGLRRSEVVGLRWSDIDFQNRTMTIRNTVVQNGKLKLEMERTKTKKSRRTIDLIESTIPYLFDLHETQKRHGIDSDKVCVWMDGKEVRPDYLSYAVKRVMKKAELPEIRMHDLRHTAASMLAATATPKQVQEFLGHEDITTTMNTYTHLGIASRKETSAIMDSVLKNSVFGD